MNVKYVDAQGRIKLVYTDGADRTNTPEGLTRIETDELVDVDDFYKRAPPAPKETQDEMMRRIAKEEIAKDKNAQNEVN